MEKYSILIQYDNADNIYVAMIPELTGCMAHGQTAEQAMREINTACRLWLETAQEEGLQIPEPMTYAG